MQKPLKAATERALVRLKDVMAKKGITSIASWMSKQKAF